MVVHGSLICREQFTDHPESSLFQSQAKPAYGHVCSSVWWPKALVKEYTRSALDHFALAHFDHCPPQGATSYYATDIHLEQCDPIHKKAAV